MIGKKELKNICKTAEGLGWSANYDGDDFSFAINSPAGQNFQFDVPADTIDEFYEKLHEYCDNFDCSDEACLWLCFAEFDENGALFDVNDLHEDVEACYDMMCELTDALAYQNDYVVA